MNKRTTKKIQPEEKLKNEQKADKKQVSPAIANALVIGSQSLVSTKLFDTEKYLKIKEVLKGMSVRDATRLLSESRELIEKESLVN
jgi:hypothetical protein